MISNRVDNISNVIPRSAEGEGNSVVRELVGHGSGRVLNEGLQVPYFAPAGRGVRLK